MSVPPALRASYDSRRPADPVGDHLGRASDTSRTLPSSSGKPNLRNVVPEDLRDTGRLLELHGQAIARGWVTTSDRDRLRFVGAAEHARVIGTKNPCGLFVRLIRCGLWSFLTQDDEDAANARLKRHLYGSSRNDLPPKVQAVRAVEFLSDDARVVRSIRAAVARTGYRGDAFPLLRREHPSWTRERWDQALAELEQAKHTRRLTQR